ncbi:MAG: hypothetical protein FH747_02055 [Stenotrophomonas sp.]|uniref:DUF6616 family protein n=1 Tax=Stenotrophomonas sp. TaxID=69392 RepID=UPI0013533227|nr:DUF6616 family protein [Stenotrophomonas sp.]MTI72431.1 hypothetical protein [Stenotrophomonas sp.]
MRSPLCCGSIAYLPRPREATPVPDTQARDALPAGIHASGGYTCFDHTNAASDEGGFAKHLQQLAAA